MTSIAMAEVPWGSIADRPYLRGLSNLALVLAQQKNWSGALAILEQMLKLNPNDNQGVRYLIGPECLRGGGNEILRGGARLRSRSRSRPEVKTMKVSG